MHLQTWFVTLFLGFSTLSSQVHGQNSDQPPSVNSQENIVEPLSLPIRIVEDDETVQRQAEELRIQRSMEKSAYWAMCVAIVSAILVSIGTVLLIRTLYWTRRANEAAQNAIKVTREVARDQARAYVQVEEVIFLWGDRFGESPEFILTAVNTGQTPAKWFEVVSACKGSKIDEVFPGFSREELASRNWSRWVSFRAGGTQTIKGNISESDFDSLKRSYGEAVYFEADPYQHEKIVITIYGTIRYCTIFDEIYEVDFFFQTLNAHKYIKISEEIIAKKSDKGLPINYTSTIERPIKPSKVPNDSLRILVRIATND